MLIAPTAPSPAAAEDAAAWTASQVERWGYEPNYAALFAARPDVARAWTALNGAIRGGMDGRRFELATIAAARELGSTYCSLAHGTFLRDGCGDPDALRALVEDAAGGGLDDVDRAVVAFARKAARRAPEIDRDDVAALRAVGLSDADIADVVFAVAARSFFATALDAAGVRADAALADALGPEATAALTVGRPVGAT